MGATLAAPVVIAAIRARLVADTTLVALLATAPSGLGGGPAMYTDGDAPQQSGTVSVAAMYPQVLLSVPSEVPFNTMGDSDAPKWGSSVLAGVKVITVARNHDSGWSILNQIVARLNGQPLTVTGYGSASIEIDGIPPPYPEVVAGLTYRHFPSLWRIHVHQS